MDKISINNIFNTNDRRVLDVNNIYGQQAQSEKKVQFSVDRLIKLREERKAKLYAEYKKQLNICLNRINTANNLNRTEVMYDVPDGLYGHSDYVPGDCLAYIKNKIKGMKLDVVVLSDRSILISWLHLEANLKASSYRD